MPKSVKHSPELVTVYRHQLLRAAQIPKLLFLSASLITILMLGCCAGTGPIFCYGRSVGCGRRGGGTCAHLGLDNVPFNGQVILVSNSHDFDHWLQVVSAIDRFARFVAPAGGSGDKFLRRVAMSTGVMIAAGPKVRLAPEDNALARGLVTLGQGSVLGVSLAANFTPVSGEPSSGEHLLSELRAKVPATILPVYCGENPRHPDAVRHPERHTYVVIGEPLAPDTPLAEIRKAVAALGT